MGAWAVKKKKGDEEGIKWYKGLKDKKKKKKKQKKKKKKKKFYTKQEELVQLELDLDTAQQLLYALTHAVGVPYKKEKKKKKGKKGKGHKMVKGQKTGKGRKTVKLQIRRR